MVWLALKYAVFAVLSMGANIGVQDLASHFYGGPFELYASMIPGTLAGLVLKYALDKRYIFYYRTSGPLEDGRMFVLYSVMGVITTCVFWGFEIGFDHVFQTRGMRYVGAVIGLTLGYWLKYRLDRRFVFGPIRALEQDGRRR